MCINDGHRSVLENMSIPGVTPVYKTRSERSRTTRRGYLKIPTLVR